MLSGNEAHKYLFMLGVSTLVFWLSIWNVTIGVSLVIETIRKFMCYLSVTVWINSAYYLRESVRGLDVESWEFQREQVKLTMFIVVVLIATELPVWIASI